MPPVRLRVQPSRTCKVKVVPMKEPRRKKEGPICSVCHEELSVKREATIGCSHRFHRTCILKWLEMQEDPMDQSCPYCRAPYDSVLCGRKKIKNVEQYGTHQQPSWWSVHSKAKKMEEEDEKKKRKRSKKESERNLVKLLHHVQKTELVKTAETFVMLESQIHGPKKKKMKKVYLQDIEAEIKLLRKRMAILSEMEQLMITAKSVGATPPEPQLRSEWNLQSELYRVYNVMPPETKQTGNAREIIEGLSNVAGMENTQAEVIRTTTVTAELDERGNPVERRVNTRVERIIIDDDTNIEELTAMGFEIVSVDESDNEE